MLKKLISRKARNIEALASDAWRNAWERANRAGLSVIDADKFACAAAARAMSSI